MTSSSSSGSELLPPFVRLAGEDRLAGVMHHRDKKKCDVVSDFGGGGGGVTSSLYALTHDVIGFGGCGSNTSMSLSTAVAAAGGVSSSVAPPRGLGLSDNTGFTSHSTIILREADRVGMWAKNLPFVKVDNSCMT